MRKSGNDSSKMGSSGMVSEPSLSGKALLRNAGLPMGEVDPGSLWPVSRKTAVMDGKAVERNVLEEFTFNIRIPQDREQSCRVMGDLFLADDPEDKARLAYKALFSAFLYVVSCLTDKAKELAERNRQKKQTFAAAAAAGGGGGDVRGRGAISDFNFDMDGEAEYLSSLSFYMECVVKKEESYPERLTDYALWALVKNPFLVGQANKVFADLVDNNDKIRQVDRSGRMMSSNYFNDLEEPGTGTGRGRGRGAFQNTTSGGKMPTMQSLNANQSAKLYQLLNKDLLVNALDHYFGNNWYSEHREQVTSEQLPLADPTKNPAAFSNIFAPFSSWGMFVPRSLNTVAEQSIFGTENGEPEEHCGPNDQDKWQQLSYAKYMRTMNSVESSLLKKLQSLEHASNPRSADGSLSPSVVNMLANSSLIDIGPPAHLVDSPVVPLSMNTKGTKRSIINNFGSSDGDSASDTESSYQSSSDGDSSGDTRKRKRKRNPPSKKTQSKKAKSKGGDPQEDRTKQFLLKLASLMRKDRTMMPKEISFPLPTYVMRLQSSELPQLFDRVIPVRQQLGNVGSLLCLMPSITKYLPEKKQMSTTTMAGHDIENREQRERLYQEIRTGRVLGEGDIRHDGVFIRSASADDSYDNGNGNGDGDGDGDGNVEDGLERVILNGPEMRELFESLKKKSSLVMAFLRNSDDPKNLNAVLAKEGLSKNSVDKGVREEARAVREQVNTIRNRGRNAFLMAHQRMKSLECLASESTRQSEREAMINLNVPDREISNIHVKNAIVHMVGDNPWDSVQQVSQYMVIAQDLGPLRDAIVKEAKETTDSIKNLLVSSGQVLHFAMKALRRKLSMRSRDDADSLRRSSSELFPINIDSTVGMKEFDHWIEIVNNLLSFMDKMVDNGKQLLIMVERKYRWSATRANDSDGEYQLQKKINALLKSRNLLESRMIRKLKDLNPREFESIFSVVYADYFLCYRMEQIKGTDSSIAQASIDQVRFVERVHPISYQVDPMHLHRIKHLQVSEFAKLRYISECCQDDSEGVPKSIKMMLAHAEVTTLHKDTEKFLYRNPYGNLTFYQAYEAQYLMDCINVFGCYPGHVKLGNFMNSLNHHLSSFFPGTDMKLNKLALGVGSSGKSYDMNTCFRGDTFLESIYHQTMCPGTGCILTGASDKSDMVPGKSGENNHVVYFYHELPMKFVSGGGSGSSKKANSSSANNDSFNTFKNMLTRAVIEYKFLVFDNATKTRMSVLVVNMMIASFSVNSNYAIEDFALASRFFTTHYSSETMNTSVIDWHSRNMSDNSSKQMHRTRCREQQLLQLALCHFFRMAECRVFTNDCQSLINTVVSDTLILKLLPVLEEKGYKPASSRFQERLCMYSKLICIKARIMDLYFYPHSPYHRQEFRVEHLLDMERMLYVDVQHFCIALSYLYTELVDPNVFAVLWAIRHLWRKQMTNRKTAGLKFASSIRGENYGHGHGNGNGYSYGYGYGYGYGYQYQQQKKQISADGGIQFKARGLMGMMGGGGAPFTLQIPNDQQQQQQQVLSGNGIPQQQQQLQQQQQSTEDPYAYAAVQMGEHNKNNKEGQEKLEPFVQMIESAFQELGKKMNIVPSVSEVYNVLRQLKRTSIKSRSMNVTKDPTTGNIQSVEEMAQGTQHHYDRIFFVKNGYMCVHSKALCDITRMEEVVLDDGTVTQYEAGMKDPGDVIGEALRQVMNCRSESKARPYLWTVDPQYPNTRKLIHLGYTPDLPGSTEHMVIPNIRKNRMDDNKEEKMDEEDDWKPSDTYIAMLQKADNLIINEPLESFAHVILNNSLGISTSNIPAKALNNPVGFLKPTNSQAQRSSSGSGGNGNGDAFYNRERRTKVPHFLGRPCMSTSTSTSASASASASKRQNDTDTVNGERWQDDVQQYQKLFPKRVQASSNLVSTMVKAAEQALTIGDYEKYRKLYLSIQDHDFPVAHLLFSLNSDQVASVLQKNKIHYCRERHYRPDPVPIFVWTISGSSYFESKTLYGSELFRRQLEQVAQACSDTTLLQYPTSVRMHRDSMRADFEKLDSMQKKRSEQLYLEVGDKVATVKKTFSSYYESHQRLQQQVNKKTLFPILSNDEILSTPTIQEPIVEVEEDEEEEEAAAASAVEFNETQDEDMVDNQDVEQSADSDKEAFSEESFVCLGSGSEDDVDESGDEGNKPLSEDDQYQFQEEFDDDDDDVDDEEEENEDDDDDDDDDGADEINVVLHSEEGDDEAE